MNIDIHWRFVRGDRDKAWDWCHVLYAYKHPTRSELLYVGKAWGTSVRDRWDARDKLDGFWAALEHERGLHEHEVLVGDLAFNGRLTARLLADVESLLIFATEPWGNISCRSSRTPRPGLRLQNLGRDWTGPRSVGDTATHVIWS